MTKEEIDKRNEAIALFYWGTRTFYEDVSWIKYNKDWNQLMPVAIKMKASFVSTDIETTFKLVSDYCLTINKR